MLTMEIILKALDIIYESRLWKDRPPSHTLKTLLYLYNKGWLYIPIENNKIKAVIGAYRIPDTNKDTLEKIPVVEQGKILYIPFVVFAVPIGPKSPNSTDKLPVVIPVIS